jgi:hypothetical protein
MLKGLEKWGKKETQKIALRIRNPKGIMVLSLKKGGFCLECFIPQQICRTLVVLCRICLKLAQGPLAARKD